MIISRTPVRISFVGGGSDIPSYYLHNSGAVVTTAINKYIYITVNKKFDNKIRVSYSKTEIVSRAGDLRHELVRECMKKVGIIGGIEITSISDIPSEGTGLGSSSSYTVGLLNALYAYKEKHITASRLAKEACEIEIDILKGSMGKQDQYIAAFGGLQFFNFFPDGTVRNNPIICKFTTRRELEKRLMLLYTGSTRSASSILKHQSANIKKRLVLRKNIDTMVILAKEMANMLMKNKLDRFGQMLDENWKLKKELTDEISNQKIDRWINMAKKNGAEGGKILGAGGGGFLLLYAKPMYHAKIKRTLAELKPVDFDFEPQGSKIIFVSE